MSKYDKLYIIGKLLCSTFRICNKNCKFAKNEIFLAKFSFKFEMFAKKGQQMIKYILTMPFQIRQKFRKILNDLMCNEENLKRCIFLLTGCMQIIFKIFFAKHVQFISSHKGKSSHSGSKSADSGSRYKSPVLHLKGGLWILRKSQKMSAASDQYFLSYLKKNYRGE